MFETQSHAEDAKGFWLRTVTMTVPWQSPLHFPLEEELTTSQCRRHRIDSFGSSVGYAMGHGITTTCREKMIYHFPFSIFDVGCWMLLDVFKVYELRVSFK